MLVVGIDPGKSGSIVLYSFGTADIPLSFIPFDPKKSTERDIADWLGEADPQFAFIERVSSSPQMGVASAFTFGRSYGYLRGLVTGLKIPFEEVNPVQWQRELKCLSKGDKNVTKSRAQQLYPACLFKITHANADALLIATYGARLLRQRNGGSPPKVPLRPRSLPPKPTAITVSTTAR